MSRFSLDENRQEYATTLRVVVNTNRRCKRQFFRTGKKASGMLALLSRAQRNSATA
jgi:hypothetical protein